jgi:hypothetical protein
MHNNHFVAVYSQEKSAMKIIADSVDDSQLWRLFCSLLPLHLLFSAFHFVSFYFVSFHFVSIHFGSFNFFSLFLTCVVTSQPLYYLHLSECLKVIAVQDLFFNL